MTDLRKLGGVVEIFNAGYELPEDSERAERAAEDVRAYIRGGAKRRQVQQGAKVILPVVNPVSAPRPTLADLPTTAGPKPKTMIETPSAPIPEYPLILISFAENPSTKFVLPFPFSYLSFRPTGPPCTSWTLPPPPGIIRPILNTSRRGNMLLSTFLPSKGWGRWKAENEASSELARKRRRKDLGPHARLGLPREDKEFSLGGCTVPPGTVEPVTMRFEGVAEVTWLALRGVEREVERCLEERRERLAREKEREVERVKKMAEKKKEEEVVVPKAGEEGEKEGKKLENDEKEEDGDTIVVLRPGTSVSKLVPERPLAATPTPEPAPTPSLEVENPSHKRPKRDSKKKRWSDGEEDVLPTTPTLKVKSGANRLVELEEEVAVEGDDPGKSFKARVFNQLVSPNRLHID